MKRSFRRQRLPLYLLVGFMALFGGLFIHSQVYGAPKPLFGGAPTVASVSEPFQYFSPLLGSKFSTGEKYATQPSP